MSKKSDAAGSTERNRVSVLVAAKLRAAIDDGSLLDAKGRLPSERKLADLLGTSRTTIREALQHLATEGVLQTGNQARARVQSNALNARSLEQLGQAAQQLMDTHGGIEEFQEARAMLEGALARHAARHATPKQISRLTQAFLENERSLGNMQAFIDSDMQFHRVLAEIPGNPIFVVIHAALSNWLSEQRRLGMQVEHSDELAHKGHREILDAIIARDPDAAESAMANHLLNVSAHYLKAKVLKLTGS